jgi:hypothetical protein
MHSFFDFVGRLLEEKPPSKLRAALPGNPAYGQLQIHRLPDFGPGEAGPIHRFCLKLLKACHYRLACRFPITDQHLHRLASQNGEIVWPVGMKRALLIYALALTVIGFCLYSALNYASIVLPYCLGVLVSLALYSNYSAPKVAFIPFALFMGIAMSITAFPVLARILEESGLAKTALGSTAITCAAVDDVTAWILLAAIVAIVHATI